MPRSRFAFLLTLLVCAAPLFSSVSSAAPKQSGLEARANSLWREGSFARAVPAFRAAIKSGALRDRDTTRLHFADALFQTGRQEAALREAQSLLRVTRSRARVWTWLGRASARRSHYGYVINGKTRRDIEDETSGAHYVDLSTIDSARALDYFEQAKLQARRERAAKIPGALSAGEEIDLNFDLAGYLPDVAGGRFIRDLKRGAKVSNEPIDATQPYNRAWNLPRKVLYLLEDVRRLDSSPTRNNAARALIAKGRFALNYRAVMDRWAARWSGPTAPPELQEKDGLSEWDEDLIKEVRSKSTVLLKPRSYPYSHLDAVAIWSQIARDYPRSPFADSALFLAARELTRRDEPVRALAVYQFIARDFPRSPRRSKVQHEIDALQKPEIVIAVRGVQAPGEAAKIALRVRNIERLDFAAYRVPLEKVWGSPAFLKNPNKSFGDFGLEHLRNAARRYGAPVARWQHNTRDRRDMRAIRRTVATPLQENGAYLVIASGPGVRAAQLVIVSDLALVKKSDAGQILLYAADARSGKPVANAGIVVKQRIYDEDYNLKATSARGTTNSSGFFSTAITQIKDSYDSKAQALVWSGSRYAFTGNALASASHFDGDEDYRNVKLYCYTDRPIYRPGQKVFWRQMALSHRENGALAPLKSAAVQIIARHDNRIILRRTFKTSEFGTANGEFVLPADAPLGEYSITSGSNGLAFLKGSEFKYGGGTTFRVEEYKRPEFTVSVEAPPSAARPGDLVKAKVRVRRYSGEGVPGARVKFTIRRSRWSAAHHFATSYDWLADSWKDRIAGYEQSYRSRSRRYDYSDYSSDAYRTGTVVTDSSGNAEIAFRAADETFCDNAPGALMDNLSNTRYSIAVEARDSSRRVVESTGEVRVAAQRYFAFLQPQSGYIRTGETASVQVAVRNANDTPVAASGTMRVFRPETFPEPPASTVEIDDSPMLPPAPPPKPEETLVHTEAITIDESGEAFWEWAPQSGGAYRIVYDGKDLNGHNIVASTWLWVAGKAGANEKLDTRAIEKPGLAIIVEKPASEEGDVARVLLVCDKPGATVLLTQETDRRILRRELVFIAGKSREISVPIKSSHAPNFTLAAVAVQNYRVLRAETGVLVPPSGALLQLSVKGDKAAYKPGETGVFTISATDRDGNPARAEVSLALTDASLYALAGDSAPDLRHFFFGGVRSLSTFSDSFLSGKLPARIERDAKPRSYKDWSLNLPSSFGKLGLAPGGGGSRYNDFYSQLIYASSSSGILDFDNAPGFSAETDSEEESTVTLAQPGQALFPVFATEPECPPQKGIINTRTVIGEDTDFRTQSLADAAYRALNFGRVRRRVQTVFNVANNALTTDGEAGTAAAMPAAVGAPPPASPQALRMAEAASFAPVQLRENFAETAFWAPSVVTEGGKAKVTVKFPDSLTQWRVAARGLTQGDAKQSGLGQKALVGEGTTEAVTAKSLALRMQGPRFWTERDRGLLSAVIRNGRTKPKHIKVSLQTSSALRLATTSTVEFDRTSHLQKALSNTIEIAPGAEMQINWPIEALSSGTATVRMTAQSDEESDAVQMQFPVVTHGAPRFAMRNGVVNAGSKLTTHLDLPLQRQRGAGRIVMQIQPSLAAAMLDALPYLADYPYGCVEQTMSRFMPAVAAEQALQNSGANLQQLRAHALAEARAARTRATAANVKNTGYTLPSGLPGSRDQSAIAPSDATRAKNPVYDEALLRRMTRDGLKRLQQMQRSDGGWGWWPDSPESDTAMTAYVVSGLELLGAKERGASGARALDRGRAFLARAALRESDLPLLCSIAESLCRAPRSSAPKSPFATGRRLAAGRLFQSRAKLTPYSQAQLALALWSAGEGAKAAVVVRNMENSVSIDKAANVARWKTGGESWDWWSNEIETSAIALRAFLRIDPKNVLVPLLTNGLLAQSRDGHWRSTKETAHAVLALSDSIRLNRELDVDLNATVTLSGAPFKKAQRRSFRITRANALTFDNRFIVSDKDLDAGNFAVTVETRGRGRLYWSLAREYFSLEEPIAAGGSGIAIARRYIKLQEVKTKNGVQAKRVALSDGAILQSGDRIEVELTLTARHQASYLVFEDMKPAGTEAVELVSGRGWQDGLVSNVEVRDDKTAFFLDTLPRGTHRLRYQLRAEVPGRFHALPTNGYAMYAPEIRANAREMRLGVRD
ncbi:MAG TPA: MG2 domain-containing protein [Abditibacteriaceae bacterium]